MTMMILIQLRMTSYNAHFSMVQVNDKQSTASLFKTIE